MGFNDTTKRYLLSSCGNKCAFPSCNKQIFDLKLKSFIGEICHIKGNKEGSARYDPNQSKKERQSYYNGIVMCRIHAKVIDSSLDVEKYTAELLTQWKHEHETTVVNDSDKSWIMPPNSIYNSFLQLKSGKLVIHFYYDVNGIPQVYSEEKLKILNSLMHLQFALSDAGTLMNALKSNPEAKAKDFLQQSYGKIANIDTDGFTSHVYKTMLETPNITFSDFIQFLAPNQDLTSPIKEAAARRNARKTFWGES